MVFSSLTFLFVFLPAVLLLYAVFFLLPMRLGRPRLASLMGNMLLLTASLFFYTWGEQILVFVMVASTVVDFISGLLIKQGKHRRGALIASIVFNLATLGIFKYLNFGVENAQHVLDMFGVTHSALSVIPAITLPIGISFYTFQSMSYTIDVYRGKVEATENFLDFFCFVTLFPQLVAGPIVRYQDISNEIKSREVTIDGFTEGCERFIIGLAKKVLVANTLAVPADMIFDMGPSELTTPLAWLGIACYTLQIYFDFSGYSDMAIGLGRIFGFTFPENFKYPYIARSIKEFWRRWHMTLSTWFRDYLYIPLGGSRVSPARTYANLWMVFLLCGLWHGASWNFLIWGAYHGLFLVVERLGLERWLTNKPALLSHGYTLLIVMIGWVFFRAESVTHATTFISAMAGFDSATAGQPIQVFLRSDVLLCLVAGIIFAAPVGSWFDKKVHQRSSRQSPQSVTKQLNLRGSLMFFSHAPSLDAMRLGGYMLLFFLSVIELSSGTYNPFIYFRF